MWWYGVAILGGIAIGVFLVWLRIVTTKTYL
jgi:hypothetical protein